MSDLNSEFREQGFCVVRSLVEPARCAAMREVILRALDPVVAPVEYESDVGYPGAPVSREAPGGATPRRLLSAYARHEVYRQFATDMRIGTRLQTLLQSPQPMLSQAHHNCVMTKHPGYSSATAWHQDIRYWSFDRPELVSVWLALGDENRRNGALRVLPGTHTLQFDRGRFDHALFLRPDLAENKPLIRRAVDVELNPGDVLFFHCRTLHAAGKNRSTEVKLSCVFTYHALDNHPIPGTRSASVPSIEVRTA